MSSSCRLNCFASWSRSAEAGSAMLYQASVGTGWCMRQDSTQPSAISQPHKGFRYNRVVPLVEARNLVKVFSSDAGVLGGSTRVTRAVDDVSLSIEPGETLGLVGESG